MAAGTPHPGAATATRAAGQSVVALYGPMLGGVIRNPATTAEQGIAPLVTAPGLVTIYVGPLGTYGCGDVVPLGTEQPTQLMVQLSTYGPPEALYVSLTGPIQFGGAYDAVLQPGDQFLVPADFPGDVWVAAISPGHRFSAVIYQPATQYPPTPYAGAFPPSGPVTKTDTIPSYLYKQYEDDDDLQALVAAQNRVTQDYVDTFNALNLPDYTSKSGALLDWVGTGLYGLPRPTFFSGFYQSIGPLATYGCGDGPAFGVTTSTLNFADVAVTSDDVYKRVLQWHLWKADGPQVSIPWLRRRVARFLYGEAQQGGAHAISVVSDGNRDLTITIETGTCTITGGALFGATPMGEVPFGVVSTSVQQNATPALAMTLKEGLDSGALELPGQYRATCRIGLVGGTPFSTDILVLSQMLFGDGDTVIPGAFLVTEDGTFLTTEDGTLLSIGTVDTSIPQLLGTETGRPLATESGQQIIP